MPDFDGKPHNPMVLSHLAIRRLAGLLGLTLPAGLYLYGLASGVLQPTISHYYYTQAGDAFVGVLCAIGVFLITYRGYPDPPAWFLPAGASLRLPGDRTASIVAAIGLFGTALFPTAPLVGQSLCGPDAAPCAEVALGLLSGLAADVSTLHLAFAATFFLAIAYFCLVLFPSGPWGHPGRIPELLTYFACGAVILVSLVQIARTLQAGPEIAVFYWEAAATGAFAIAWIVNGKVLVRVPGFRDRPSPR